MIPQELKDMNKGLSDWNVLTAYRGSIAHGMFVPNSDPDSIDDKDIMCVCIPPLEYYFGLKTYGSRGTKENKFNEWDCVTYEFKKFISLLIKSNPNVLGMLWLEEKHYIYRAPIIKELIERRDLFVSKQAYYSFAGYAKGQMHRMTHGACLGYMGAKRKALVKQHGYDTKNAGHLIRLLRMAIEFLNDGKLYVERKHDATELLEIKKGKWSLEKVQKEADRLFDLADKAYMHSALPLDVDKKFIGEFCTSLLEGYFQNERMA